MKHTIWVITYAGRLITRAGFFAERDDAVAWINTPQNALGGRAYKVQRLKQKGERLVEEHSA